MNSRINWIKHKGKQILYLDFSNSTVTESRKNWIDAEDLIVNYKGDLPLRMLLNATNVKYDKETQNAFREVRDKSKNIPQKWAVVGASAGAAVMIRIINIFTKESIFFTDTIDKGKEILVSK